MEAWDAYDHAWGKAKVHWIKEKPESPFDAYDPARRKRLLCGRWVDVTPGRPLGKVADSVVTCIACRQKKITLEEQPYQNAQREQRQAAWQAQHEEDRQRWRNERMQELLERYDRPDWAPLRQKVLQRDKWTCQGCGQRRATTVHHLTYERLGREMLFDLVSLCLKCHAEIHPHLREKLPF